ncbi:WD domain, G-beta repeat [Roseimaritima multifibrata]|uniref:WD domain, G-beta repeat n=1 Tax=Roseimaritima multifibrata TaxID=1930274 RepID=A0A517MD27_9BACT|nr:c-type cytochrome domain-containing protein [Roseimaritima multifibrata]QDS92790.1 WD domain, G-beta repeat [Roseimaritima multifibrata]
MQSDLIMLRYALSTLMIASLVSTAGAADAAPAEKAAAKITYEDHIKPIFREKCLTCHNQGDAKGGLALDTYAGTMEGGGSGEIVYDGDAESSRLWQLVAHEDTPVMPPNQDKIDAAKIEMIAAWINGGLLENSGSKAKKKKNSLAFSASGSGRPEGDAAMPQTVLQQPVVVSGRASAASSLAASPWAPLVAVGGQKQIVLYNTDTLQLAGVLPFPEGLVHSLRFSRDGGFIIAGGGEGAALGIVAVYDVKTGDRLAVVGDELDAVLGADVNDKMTQIALGGPQKMLRIYDLGSGELLFDIKKHTDWIYDVAFSPDGILLASCDRAAGLMVWEADTGRNYLNLTDHKGPINALAWRDDSNVLATASDDGTVKLFEMNDGKAIKSLNAHGGGVMDVAFDHQGRLVTCGKDNRVKLWDATGKEIANFPAMAEDVLEVTITHDGKRVIAGDWTGTFNVFNSDDAKKVAGAVAANPLSLEQRSEAAKAEVAKLLPPVQAAEAALVAVRAQVDKVTAEKLAMVNQQTEKMKQVAAKDAEKVAAEKLVADLTAQRAQLRTVADQKQQESAAAIKALAEGKSDEAKVAAVETAFATALQAVAAKRTELAAAQAKVGPLVAAAKAMRAEADKQAAAIAAVDKKIAELTAKVAPAEQTLAAAKTAHQQATEKLQQVNTALDLFKKRGAELSAAAAAAADDEVGGRVKQQAALFSTAYQQ